jgi:hypothetical protein
MTTTRVCGLRCGLRVLIRNWLARLAWLVRRTGRVIRRCNPRDGL